MKDSLDSSCQVSAIAREHVSALQFPVDAWQPYLSEELMTFHHGAHYQGYVDSLNRQLEVEEELVGLPLEEIVKKSYNHGNPLKCFNNAAQVFNHKFFFDSIDPKSGGGEAKGELLELIERDFVSFTAFKSEFTQAANSLFGSGWVWLSVKVDYPYPECFYKAPEVFTRRLEDRIKTGRLVIETTKNAMNPLVFGHYPILTVDLWEHAYYLDYLNDRASYVDAFIDNLVSWDTAERRLLRTKSFVTMRPPPFPKDPEYEKQLSDEEWLLLNRRANRNPDKQAETEVKLEKELVKVRKMERRKKKAAKQELKEQMEASSGEVSVGMD